MRECKTKICTGVPPDLETYNLQSNIQFNATPLTVVVECPAGFICVPGEYPNTVVYPPGTFVFPRIGTTIRAQGCQSWIEGTIDEVLAELARQQAECATHTMYPPRDPGPGPNITLGAISKSAACNGTDFLATITATTPGNPAVTFSILSGDLPTGTTLSSSGKVATISGILSTVGAFSFYLKAGLPDGTFTVRQYTVGISGILPADLDDAIIDEAYSAQLSVGGPSTGAETWEVTSGTLPPGLTLNPATGEISGTATEEGEFTFIVCFSNDL